MSTLNPGGEHRTVLMGDDEPVLKIKLPRGIGYVLIMADDTDGTTHRRPMVEVRAVSEATEEHPAQDDRLYHTEVSVLYNNRVYMTGYKPEEMY